MKRNGGVPDRQLATLPLSEDHLPPLSPSQSAEAGNVRAGRGNAAAQRVCTEQLRN